MKEGVHACLVRKLEKKIKKDYLRVLNNFSYGPKTRCLGEIDLFAWKKDTLDFYEVKCNNGSNLMETAVVQLTSARHYLGFSGTEFIYTPQRKIQTLEEVTENLTANSLQKIIEKLEKKDIPIPSYLHDLLSQF